FEFNGSPVSVGLTVYSDGCWGDSVLTTEVSDAFLNDLSQWLVSTFSFRDPRQLITRPFYDSRLYLESDVMLNDISEKPRWPPQNRPFMATSKPAISNDARTEFFTSILADEASTFSQLEYNANGLSG